MKITDVECHVLLAPNYDPAFTSSAQDSFLVLIRTDEGLNEEELALVDGVIAQPTRPGLGIELNWDAVKAYKVA